MIEIQELKRAQRLEARGWRLVSHAGNFELMKRLSELRAADITAKLVAVGEIDGHDYAAQLDAFGRFAEDPELACAENRRVLELAERANAEIQASDAAEQQLEIEARQADELLVIRARSAAFQARTAELNAEIQAKDARIKALQELEQGAKERDADAAVAQLIARGVIADFDEEEIADRKQMFIRDPDLIALTLRLPDYRIRFIGRSAF